MGMIIVKDRRGISRPPSCLCIDCSKNPPEDAHSMNQELSQALLSLRPRMRSFQMEKCLLQILRTLPDHAIIREIDVMFNPAYSIDVMATLISAYKQKPFSLIWPGTLQDDRLIYGEEGYADYKVFDINDYDIICER